MDYVGCPATASGKIGAAESEYMGGRTRRIPPAPRHASSSGCPPPCRLRRSLRLCGQRRGSGSYWITGTTDCASVQPNTEEVGGSTTAVPKPTITLTQLPLEVMFQIFLHCDVDSLGVLSICSIYMRDRVASFLSWPPALTALSFTKMQQKDAIKQCKSLGVLMKRISCLFPTKDRLRIMLRFIEKFVSRPALVRSRLPRDVEATIRQWHQYGAYLMTAVVGWVDNECQLVYNVFAGLSWAHRFTVRVLGARPGHLRREEMALRQFIRCLFLSEVRNEESCAWLFRILQPWPLVFRAKLIYIIYGPCCHYEILWTLPSLPHTALMSQLLRSSLAHMAGVVTCLHEDAAGWNSDDTITVLEELFALSREWLPANRAMLLAHCSLDICVQLLASKIINGRKAEVASIFFNLILVHKAVPQSARFIVDVAKALQDMLGQTHFLQEIPFHSTTFLRSALRYYPNAEDGYDHACHSLGSFIFSMLENICQPEPDHSLF